MALWLRSKKKTPKKAVPRLAPLAIAQILNLRRAGKSFPEIAKAPLVRKKDGTRPTQQVGILLCARPGCGVFDVSRAMSQACAYVCGSKVASKTRGTWKPHAGSGHGGGRPLALSDAQKKEVVRAVKKRRFSRIRAPWVKKYLKLKASARTIRRAINEAGFHLPRPINRRVLDSKTKTARRGWAEARLVHTSAFWKRRSFGDASFWHVPRSAAEVAANRGAKQRAVYRTVKEGRGHNVHPRTPIAAPHFGTQWNPAKSRRRREGAK